jgi:hypothetical protein
MHKGFANILETRDNKTGKTVRELIDAHITKSIENFTDAATSANIAIPTFSIQLNGHSLGGAKALKNASDMHKGPLGQYIDKITTFGAPCVFNVSGAIAFNKHYGPKTTQWINWGDPVAEALLNLPGNFSHVGKVNVMYGGANCAVLDTEGYRAAVNARLKLLPPASAPEIALVAESLTTIDNQTSEALQLGHKEIDKRADLLARSPDHAEVLKKIAASRNPRGLESHYFPLYERNIKQFIYKLSHGEGISLDTEPEQAPRPLSTWLAVNYDNKPKDGLLSPAEQAKIPGKYVVQIASDYPTVNMASNGIVFAVPTNPKDLQDIRNAEAAAKKKH